MKSFARNKKGQFVIIAVLLVALMIISVGALLHGAVTYYKHEPWEEYSTLIGDIELNSRRLLELSLVNYTQTDNVNVLNYSLGQWRLDLMRMYRSSGITLNFTLENGPTTVYGESLDFAQGLAKRWNQSVSVSSARANFTLSIGSIGLEGYKFTAEAFLKLRVIDYTANEVNVAVHAENNMPVSDLKAENFKVNGAPVANITSSYDPTYTLKYTIPYAGASPPMVDVWDNRAIHITGFKP